MEKEKHLQKLFLLLSSFIKLEWKLCPSWSQGWPLNLILTELTWIYGYCVSYFVQCVFKARIYQPKQRKTPKARYRKSVFGYHFPEKEKIRMQDKLDLYSGEHFSEFVAYFEPQPSSINYWQQELGCWQHLFTRPQVIFSYHLCIAARPLSR